MGDPLSITTGALTLITTTVTIVKYVKDVKDSSETKASLLAQLNVMKDNLEWVHQHAEEVMRRPQDPAAAALKGLVTRDDDGVLRRGELLMEVEKVFEEMRKKLRAKKTTQQEETKWRARCKIFSAPFLWPVIEKGVREKLVDLARLNEDIGKKVNYGSIATGRETNQLAKTSLFVEKETRSNVQSFHREWKERGMEKDFNKLLDWISLTPVEDPRDQVPEETQIPGDWLARNEIVTAWTTGRPWSLMLYGEPGHGKTMLASYIAQHLRDLSVPDNSNLVVTVFLKHERRDTQTFDRLLAFILRQLVAQRSPDDDLGDLLILWKQSRHDGRQLNRQQILNFIKVELKRRKNSYFILDGLDEAVPEVEAELLDKLANLQHEVRCQESTLSLLYTSRKQLSPPALEVTCSKCGRDNPKKLQIYFVCDLQAAHGDDFHICQRCADAQEECRHPPHNLHEPYSSLDLILQPDDAVIQKYVHKLLHRTKTRGTRNRNGDLSEHGKLPNMSNAGIDPLARVISKADPGLEQTILERISSRANGSFLLAKAQYEHIKDVANVRQVESLLKTLPSEFNSLYETALERIHDLPTKRREKGLELLMWLICSKRVMSYLELQDALSVQLDDYLEPAAGLDNRTRDRSIFRTDDRVDLDAYINATEGLLHYSEKGGVTLMHRTAYEYFEEISKVPDKWARWFPSLGGHSQIALTCMAYLAHTDAKLPFSGADKFQTAKERIIELPFAQYSSQQWGAHAALAENDADVRRKVSHFLSDDKVLAATSQISSCCEAVYPTGWDVPDGASAIHIAAWHNLVPDLEQLSAAHGVDDRDTTRHERTPLMYAARNGSVGAIRHLLSAGANVNEVDLDGFTALRHATSSKHATAIQEICNRDDLDVNELGPHDQTCLMMAAVLGNEELIRSLTAAAKANVNATNGAGQTALAFSMDQKLSSATGTLLELPGIDVDLADVLGFAPLHRAASRGRGIAVQLLLEKGADHTLLDGDGRTPLWHAVSQGHMAVIEKFSQHAGVTIDGDVAADGGTLLHAACHSENPEVISWVLSKGVPVDATDAEGRTALHLAGLLGQAESAKVLKEKGASTEVQDAEGKTPDRLARSEGNFTTANVIEGVSPRSPTESEIKTLKTPVLAKRGRAEVLYKRLRDRPNDIKMADKHGRTALHHAVHEDHEACVKILLDIGRGQDVTNAADDQGITPLLLATGHHSSSGSAIIELLLAHSPPPELETCSTVSGNTALGQLLERGNIQSAIILIGAGANLPPKISAIPLSKDLMMRAIRSGNKAAVERLLDYDVQPEFQHVEVARASGDAEMLNLLQEPRPPMQEFCADTAR